MADALYFRINSFFSKNSDKFTEYYNYEVDLQVNTVGNGSLGDLLINTMEELKDKVVKNYMLLELSLKKRGDSEGLYVLSFYGRMMTPAEKASGDGDRFNAPARHTRGLLANNDDCARTPE